MMNMKALGNNFGVAEIEFRSWQERGLVILNGVVRIDTENESYKAAEVLEITVPDLSISRSAVTAVFLRSSKADGGKHDSEVLDSGCTDYMRGEVAGV